MHLQRDRVQLCGCALLRLHIGHACGCLAGAVHGDVRAVVAAQIPGGAGDVVSVQVDRVGAGLAVGGKTDAGLRAGELAASSVDLLLVDPAAGAEVRGLLDFLEVVVARVTVVRGNLVRLVNTLRDCGLAGVDGGVVLGGLVEHAGAGAGLTVGIRGVLELHGVRSLVHCRVLSLGVADAHGLGGAHGGAAHGHGACNLVRVSVRVGSLVVALRQNLGALAACSVLSGLGVVHGHPLHLLPGELVAGEAAGHEVREHCRQLRVFLVHVLTLAGVGRVGACRLQVECVGEEVVVREDEAVFLHGGQDHAGELVVGVAGVCQVLFHIKACGQEAALTGAGRVRVLAHVQLAVGALRGEGGGQRRIVSCGDGHHVVDLAGLELVHTNLGELVRHTHHGGGAVLEGQPVVVFAHAAEVRLSEHVAAGGHVVGRRVVNRNGDVHGTAGACGNLVGNLAGGLVDGRAGHVLCQAELRAASNRVGGAGVAGLRVNAHGRLDGDGLAGVAAANVVVLNLGALGGGRVAAAHLHAGGAGVGLCVCILDELEVGAPDAGRLVIEGDGLVAGEAVVLGKPLRNRDAAGEDALVLRVGVHAVVTGDDLDVLLVRVRGVHGEGRDVLVATDGLGAVLLHGAPVDGGGDGVVARIGTVFEEGAADFATVSCDGFGAGKLLRCEGVAGELAAQGRGVLGGGQLRLGEGGVDRCESVDGLSLLVGGPVAGRAGCDVGDVREGRHGAVACVDAGDTGYVTGGGGCTEGRGEVRAGDDGCQCCGGSDGGTAAVCRALCRVFGCSCGHVFLPFVSACLSECVCMNKHGRE